MTTVRTWRGPAASSNPRSTPRNPSPTYPALPCAAESHMCDAAADVGQQHNAAHRRASDHNSGGQKLVKQPQISVPSSGTG
nr:uncharacterized protein CTRU02_05931 [Colletotrichum truncatum]KAF6793676.1 hypothetical protein CTRU02_05931 [Colletotrichum truncatum]